MYVIRGGELLFCLDELVSFQKQFYTIVPNTLSDTFLTSIEHVPYFIYGPQIFELSFTYKISQN